MSSESEQSSVSPLSSCSEDQGQEGASSRGQGSPHLWRPYLPDETSSRPVIPVPVRPPLALPPWPLLDPLVALACGPGVCFPLPLTESNCQYARPEPWRKIPSPSVFADPTRYFKCVHCEKVYGSAPALHMHLRTHNRGCLCPVCGKSFSRHWLLQGHLRTHTGEKPFKCQVCAKRFADKSNMRAHVQTHSGVKPWSCPRCGKCFALKSYLSKHQESACVRPYHHHNTPTPFPPLLAILH